MSDDTHVDPLGDLPDGVADVLARAETWTELPPGLEDAVVAAIRSEAPRGRRTRSLPWWLSAAAAAIVVVTGAALLTQGGDDGDGIAVALEPTDLAPDASGTARFEATPSGLKIVLDTERLPPAPADEFYEAWIGNGDVRVSCGSFHLRGGSQPIALWAGVDDPSFDTLTVTREPLDGDAASSGQVVLRGEFEMP